MVERASKSWLFAIAAFAVAAQVASKAARDGIFLGTFSPALLPRAMILTAGASFLAILFSSWAQYRFGARKAVAGLFLLSGILFVVEWSMLSDAPESAAMLIYGHVGGLGALLVSGFWSLATAALDARRARLSFGHIGLGATLGGLIGGVGAERIVSVFGVPSLLLVLAVAQLVCAFMCSRVGVPSVEPPKQSRERSAVFPMLVRNSYLRTVALLVIVTASAGGLLDYLLKANAEAFYSSADDLTRFFGLFYTVTALIAFVAQLVLGRQSLERLGLAATGLVLPIVIWLGSIGLLIVPGIATAVLARGGESVVRNSFYRSASNCFLYLCAAKSGRG